MAAKIDFNLIVSFLTTVYNKRTQQARQQVTTKIRIRIIDEYHGPVFLGAQKNRLIETLLLNV